MLDSRLHRAALLAVMLPALIIAAFSLRPPLSPRTSALAPDAFDQAAASADLKSLAAIPDRSPGSGGDAVAARFIAERFRAAGLRVSTEAAETETVSGRRQTIVVKGTRTGFSQRTVVIAADRANPGSGSAGLTGTAALLELGRVIGGRTLNNQVEVVSTGAGPGGQLAGYGPSNESVAGALILGDMGSGPISRPVVVPWAQARGTAAPISYERSVAAAVRSETGVSPGGQGSLTRLARLMLPLTTGWQGGLVADGVPAVTLSSASERAIPEAPADATRLDAFGRAALRVASLLDGAGPDWPGPNSGAVPIRDRVLPDWATRLLGAAGIVVALAAGIDGLARARRRKIAVIRPALWIAAGWPPFLLAWLWLLLAGSVGLLGHVPEATPPVGSVPIHWVALLVTPVVAFAGWKLLRPRFASALSEEGDPGPGVASAAMLIGAVVAAVVWVGNPLTAIMIVPFINVAPWLCDPERAPSRRASLVVLVLALLPVVLVAGVVAGALGAGPFEFAWTLVLTLACGSVTPAGGLALTLGVALFAAVLALCLRERPDPTRGVVTRGPLTYAGPGSLGGTESALRGR